MSSMSCAEFCLGSSGGGIGDDDGVADPRGPGGRYEEDDDVAGEDAGPGPRTPTLPSRSAMMIRGELASLKHLQILCLQCSA